MIVLKNTMFQPMVVNRKDGSGLHFGPREIINMTTAEFNTADSSEMRKYIANGKVIKRQAAARKKEVSANE